MTEHTCAQCAGYDGCGFCLFHAIIVDPGDEPCDDFEEDERMAWPKPSQGECAVCGRKTATKLLGARLSMPLCTNCRRVMAEMSKLMILSMATEGNHGFDTDDTIMNLALGGLIPKDAVLDKISGKPIQMEGARCRYAPSADAIPRFRWRATGTP